MSIASEFSDFITETNKDGSNKAGSYLLALNNVNVMLRGGFLPDFPIDDIYQVEDLALLKRLSSHIHKEGRNPDTELLKAPVPPSHITNRFCGSAVNALIGFLENELSDATLLKQCESGVSPRKAAQKIATSHASKRTFRKLVLDNFGNACCLTGLDIRETLMAAIIAPNEDQTRNLQPDNALCLSATYAEAFKSHLITFDEKMQLVLSKALKDHTTSAIFRQMFLTYEGTRMRQANTFQPAEKYLAQHRELLVG